MPRRAFVTIASQQALADAIRGFTEEEGKMLPRDMPAKILGIKVRSDFLTKALQGQVETLSDFVIDRVTCVRPYTFYTNPNLSGSLVLNECLEIGEYAFYSTKITGIELGKCARIADNAFRGCRQLKTVKLSKDILEIGANAFYGCTGIAFEIDLPEDYIQGFPWGASDCTVTWTGTGEVNLIKKILEKTVKEIPADIAAQLLAVRQYCFYECVKLSGVIDLPAVQTIGTYAFYGCSGITEVHLGADITTIANYAFSTCNALTKIVIDRPSGSVSGAPWGANRATIEWTG